MTSDVYKRGGGGGGMQTFFFFCMLGATKVWRSKSVPQVPQFGKSVALCVALSCKAASNSLW